MRRFSADFSKTTRGQRPALGLLLSVFLHAAAILLILSPWIAPPLIRDGGGPGLFAGGGGGGGGGGGSGAVSLPAFIMPPPPAVEVAETTPVEVKETPPPEPEPEPEPVPAPVVDTLPRQVALADSGSAPGPDTTGQTGGVGPGSGGGSGGGQGTGQGTGAGSGAGPGDGGGEGAGRGPQLKQALMAPEDPPGDLRGTTVYFSLWISATGEVDRVLLKTEIEDRKYEQKLRERLLSFTFRPARSPTGAPVASRWDASWTF